MESYTPNEIAVVVVAVAAVVVVIVVGVVAVVVAFSDVCHIVDSADLALGMAPCGLWNGPVGVFENDLFAEGTRCLSKAISKSEAFSLAGGGETLSAINKYINPDDVSYCSTGGGAFLEFMEGKTLPSIKVLNSKETGS